MIGHSPAEYVFIRISIWALQLITPLSILYVLASLYHGTFLYSPLIGWYALVETLFYFCVYLPRSRILQRPAIHPTPLTASERKELFSRCFARLRDVDSATGWFCFSDSVNIKRDNMIEWMLWALFNVNMDGLRPEWEEEIQGYITMIEGLLGRKLEPGWDESVRCMKVSLDQVDMLHRPFGFYVIVAFIDLITSIELFKIGFQHYTFGNIFTCFPPRLFSMFSHRSSHPEVGYWYRPHRSSTKDPILFIHGIGIGLWPYVHFLNEVAAADPDVGIVVIEMLSISMHMTSPPLTRPAMLDAITHVLDHHNLQRVVVVSHSYGTIITAHMIHDPVLSKRISASIMIDPIPFLLHFPAVAYNFVYREPKRANEWQLWYFASRDPDIARALARHFFWSENIMFKEDMHGRRLGVVLSGQDQIVDAKEVKNYLTEREDVDFKWEKDGWEVLYYPDLDHAQVFDTKERRGPIVEMLSRFIREEHAH